MMAEAPLLGEDYAEAQSARVTSTMQRTRRNLQLRGGADFHPAVLCGGCGCCTFLLIIITCIASLSPNQYGIQRNYISGAISAEVHRGGLHFMPPWKGYVTFPATQVILEWSSHSIANRAPIMTRTGADPNDPDSGGQPISIGCALQIQFVPGNLREVFLGFGGFEGAKERYLLLAGNMVGNTAQEFTPQDFWERREVVTLRMLHQINQTLWHHGFAVAVNFQVMRIDFAQKFEDAITGVQVAEQQKVVNEYEQSVARVVQEIEVMRATNNANIRNISSGADAQAREVCAAAKRDAFNMKQAMKAQKYTELKNRLHLSERNMAEYFKIKTMQFQAQQGKLVVGVPNIGDASSGSGTTPTRGGGADVRALQSDSSV